MAGLKHLFDIYNKKGRNFVEDLISKFININEKMDASAFIVQKDRSGKLNFYKRGTNQPITFIDRVLAKYYESPIRHFETLSYESISKVPNNYIFGLEYFASKKPVEIIYDRIPKNNLILSYINIRNNEGKIIKTIQDKKKLDQWADLLEVERPPIIFQGFLTKNQKLKILDFLDTPFDELVDRFKTESFVKFIISILNPKLRKTSLNKDIEKSIEGIVFRFGEEGKEELVSAKLVDPVFTHLAKEKNKNKRTKSKPNDIYSLTVLDLMNYLNQINLKKYRIKGRTFEERYISLISQIFNSFIEDYGDKYKGVDFEVPDHLKREEFDIGRELIDNPKALENIEENDSYKQLFRILVASFRKKRKIPKGLFTKDIINQFNLTVAMIKDRVSTSRIMENEELPTFGEFAEIRSSSIESLEEEEDEIAFGDFKDKLDYVLEEPVSKSSKPKKGKKKVNIIVGRFQPFHNGHLKMAEFIHKKNKLPVVVVAVHPGHNRSGKSPFSKRIIDSTLINLGRDTEGIIMDHVFVKQGYIEDIINSLRPEYEPIIWGAGEDRINSYQKQAEYNFKRDNELNVDKDRFEIVETPRVMSASNARELIITDNFKEFKKLVPRSIASQWILLKKELEKESEESINESEKLLDKPEKIIIPEDIKIDQFYINVEDSTRKEWVIILMGRVQKIQ